MNAHSARMEFAPPPTPGLMRALGLAILAHALLLAVLTVGVQWKRDAIPVTVEAELWSALPVQAAPKAPDPLPPPPEPEPEVKPIAKVAPPPEPVAPPKGPDPSIAIAKEKARLLKEKQMEQDRLELEKRQKDALKAKKLQDEKQARETALREKEARDKKLQLEQQKLQSAKTDADAKKIAELRKLQIERMNRMADQATGSGESNDKGLAKQSSGPSASYAGRIVARIKPNITYTESMSGNPVADVEVRTSPDGTIISRKLIKSSGVKSWDDAVINAIDKTEKLPPDVDGRVIPSLTLGFRPKD
ncbi:cell envelope integrity protein TolA [Rhodoferax sp. AJA081-3]|uniref:cell envelope integrity protein TolA n=1 Tax=Rhodoferax sp. AJA081-3 TaxID=2752316 RepID=UPI001ADF29E7|nr:cell envelope integrity protein TolA [Rhodoferax sp. AJA081-3]QTN29295.1 cell envelope integrity protein TolA [Rhodoferax sp. AJA081-3]